MATNSVPLSPEIVVQNKWFDAAFVRQPDDRLLGHIRYHKYTPEAKQATLDMINGIDEPIYGAVQDQKQLKYLTSLGFEPTGDLLACEYPGKEGTLMGQVVYYKGGMKNLWNVVYQEESRSFLPIELVDGAGKIYDLEEKLARFPSAHWETRHHFSDGVYTRETFIPKGTLLTGHKHKTSTVCMITYGVMSVITVDEQGKATHYGILKAPQTFVTEAKTKKAIFTHEDSVMMNSFSLAGLDKKYHNEESLEEVEDFIFEKWSELCLV